MKRKLLEAEDSLGHSAFVLRCMHAHVQIHKDTPRNTHETHLKYYTTTYNPSKSINEFF